MQPGESGTEITQLRQVATRGESATMLEATFGSQHKVVGDLLLNNLARIAGWYGTVDEKTLNGAVAAVHDMAPADALQGMLAVQAVGMHLTALEALRRAHIPGQDPDVRSMNIGHANKASRTFAALVEALSKRQGKTGQQKMTVEHVHVGDGGQAIIGNVEGGRGRNAKGRTTP